MFRIGKQASELYGSEAWEVVRSSLSEQSRAEAVQGLRAVATVATAMADSLETGMDSNYGLVR